MNTSQKRLARLSMLAALGIVVLFIGSVLPSAKLACVAISGIFCAAALMMYGYGWSAALFFVTAALALLLLPNKLCAILYVSFFGFYPICKSLFESKIRSKALCIAAKLLLLSIVFWLGWCFMWGWWLNPGSEILSAAKSVVNRWYILWPGCMIVFFIYDTCFSFLIQFYIQKISGYFK